MQVPSLCLGRQAAETVSLGQFCRLAGAESSDTGAVGQRFPVPLQSHDGQLPELQHPYDDANRRGFRSGSSFD